MRRFFAIGTLAVTVATSVACEDGPNQTFSPTPSGARDRWGDTDGGGYAEDKPKDYSAVGGVKNANELCTPIEKHAKWAEMVKRPILPPALGGINILGGDDKATTFAGLTIDEAEKVLCQSTPIGAEYTDNNPYNCWGDNCEVTLGYLASNRRGIQIEVHAGYKGTLEAKSRDGAHKYIFSADNLPITKDGAAFPLHWKDAVKVRAEINELYDAISATYTTFIAEPDCIATAHCRIADFDDGGGYFSFGTLGFLFRVSSTIAAQPAPSIPERIILRPVKIMGYSFADTLLKFDATGEGPVATDPNALGTGKTCTVKMGLDFKTFRESCVQVWGGTDKAANGELKNDIELKKLFGGIAHNDERFSFSIAGLNSNFSDKTLADDDIVRDKDRPSDDDVATTFNVSSSTLGRIANDYTGNDVTKAKDYHGIGLVTLEWAYIVQRYFQDSKYPNPADPNRKTLGDPRCLGAAPADGCTGLEGIATTAPAASLVGLTPTEVSNMRVNALGAAAATSFSGYRIGLKPGSWRSYYCTDANGVLSGAGSGYHNCVGAGGFDSYFITAYNRLKAVWGGGDETKIPIEARDVRFLFKQWTFALIKYFQVAGNAAATIAQVHAGIIDPDNLFFDAIGAGQYEFAEYIDRHLVNSAGQDPTDLVITADILHGLVSNFEFSRDLYRGEQAIYDALLTDRAANKVGSENSALLMNIVGNPIVASLYHDVAMGWTGYKCATENFGANDVECEGQQVLTDAIGNVLYNEDVPPKPALTKYPGAFAGGRTPFAMGLPSKMKILEVKPFIRAAKVSLPIHQNPFDHTSMDLAPHVALIPYIPKGNGAGFPIAVNGSQDKFINTYELDFSGTTISLNVNFQYPPNPQTAQEDTTKDPVIRATETTDFLGEVFICQHAATGDVLRVRMYSSVQTILQWFTEHPGATDDCDAVFRYSTYGNYLDFITTRAYGFRLGINPGAGNGRVIDMTVYDPTLN